MLCAIFVNETIKSACVIVVVYVILAFYAFLVLNSMGAVMLDNRQPVKTIAWILVILLIPVIGLLFYYFFGQNIRREIIFNKKSLDLLMQKKVLKYVCPLPDNMPQRFRSVVELMRRICYAEPFSGNNTRFYTDGNDFILNLLNDIGRARHHVHLEFFIINDDPVGRLVADALIDAARRGIVVRFLYDDVGCWSVRRSSLFIFAVCLIGLTIAITAKLSLWMAVLAILAA